MNERKRVLSFEFVPVEGEPSREPGATTKSLRINGVEYDLAKLPEAIREGLAWYGLKQKLSDYEAGDKKGMSAAERLASISECYAMLEAGDWSRAGGRGVEAPATEAELAEAIIRIARVRKAKVTAEQAEAAAKKLAGTDLPEAVKAMVRAIRTEARADAKAATATTGGDLSELFA